MAGASDEGQIDGPTELKGFLQGTKGLMVLFREGLVKADASGAAFAGLDRHCRIDAPTGTAFLDGFLKGVFQVAQWPGQAAGNFEKAMVDGTHFHRHGSILPGSLSSTETGHATNHWGPFSFHRQC